MRKITLQIVLIFLAVSCTKPILIQEVGINKDGNFHYGGNGVIPFYVDKSIEPELNLKWIADTDGSFSNNSVITYDEFMFASDLSGNIFCFSDTSGKKLGVNKNKGSIDITPVLLNDKLIYVVNNYKENFATLYFYQFIQGRIHKAIELPGNYTSEMIVEDDGITLLSEKGMISKYNLIGDLEWEYDADILTFSDPVLSKDIIYFTSAYGEIIGFNIKKQQIILEEQISERIESGPCIIDDKLLTGDNNGILYCYNLTNNKMDWTFDTGSKILTQPVLDKNDNIYIGNLGGCLYSIDMSGKVNWKYTSNGIMNAVPLVFNNVLLQPDMNRKLLLIDTKDGKLLNEIEFERRVRTAPAFYNNKVYIGVDKNEIYAYEVVEK